MRTEIARASLLFAVVTAVACSIDTAPYGNDTLPPNPQPLGDGRIFIDWTVGGQPPDALRCAGIDHLSLKLDYRGTGVRVEPIPCDLDRFRYDGLPTGSAQLTLTAFTASGCATSSGTAAVVVTATLPATPTPRVPIDAPHACP